MKFLTHAWLFLQVLFLEDDLATNERRYTRGLINKQAYLREVARINQKLEKLKSKL